MTKTCPKHAVPVAIDKLGYCTDFTGIPGWARRWIRAARRAEAREYSRKTPSTGGKAP